MRVQEDLCPFRSHAVGLPTLRHDRHLQVMMMAITETFQQAVNPPQNSAPDREGHIHLVRILTGHITADHRTYQT